MTLHLKSGGSPFSVSAPFFSSSSVRLSKVLCADLSDNGRFAVCGGQGPRPRRISKARCLRRPAAKQPARAEGGLSRGAHAGNLHTALKSRRRFHGASFRFVFQQFDDVAGGPAAAGGGDKFGICSGAVVELSRVRVGVAFDLDDDERRDEEFALLPHRPDRVLNRTADVPAGDHDPGRLDFSGEDRAGKVVCSESSADHSHVQIFQRQCSHRSPDCLFGSSVCFPAVVPMRSRSAEPCSSLPAAVV